MVSLQVVSSPLGWYSLSSFLVIWWHSRSICRLWGGWCALPGTISFFSQCWLYIYTWLLSSPWPRCWSFYLCVWCWAYFFPFWSVRPQVCSVLVWSVSNAPGGTDHGRGINDSTSTHAKLADIQKALAHNAWSHILFVHAITGFDTIPAPYNIGKQKNCVCSGRRDREGTGLR